MIKIIKANVKDAKLIAEIGKKTFCESHGISASKADINAFVSEKYTKEALVKQLENSKNNYHLIYYNNKLAGFTNLELNCSNTNIEAKNVSKLDRFYLLKEFYGQKLGLKLFQFNLEISKKHKQKGMWLAVWVENKRAINFYQKAGFKIVGKYDFQISKTHSNPNHIMYVAF
ncbi:GNAT family N-acetyltransferase [Lutibacter sp. A64]|uniref:GNAT family N-acetyltransferase n=1 Tax=Lutibacter sp. A64 TaxID=2918526 RepID=UPI001F06856D|nr:GNAT family N-acetyltransferase [Lutibacter sp. A64]UMB53012.1 GNAT family N-acetyltransferase [Lutibacter sp. A64]